MLDAVVGDAIDVSDPDLQGLFTCDATNYLAIVLIFFSWTLICAASLLHLPPIPPLFQRIDDSAQHVGPLSRNARSLGR